MSIVFCYNGSPFSINTLFIRTLRDMEEELALIKKLETLTLHHEELNATIDRLNSEKFKDEFQLHRLKKEKLQVRDEICKLQDAIYPDIIA